MSINTSPILEGHISDLPDVLNKNIGKDLGLLHITSKLCIFLRRIINDKYYPEFWETLYQVVLNNSFFCLFIGNRYYFINVIKLYCKNNSFVILSNK